MGNGARIILLVKMSSPPHDVLYNPSKNKDNIELQECILLPKLSPLSFSGDCLFSSHKNRSMEVVLTKC